jgi:hypothetical protein
MRQCHLTGAGCTWRPLHWSQVLRSGQLPECANARAVKAVLLAVSAVRSRRIAYGCQNASSCCLRGWSQHTFTLLTHNSNGCRS